MPDGLGPTSDTQVRVPFAVWDCGQRGEPLRGVNQWPRDYKAASMNLALVSPHQLRQILLP